MLHQQVKNNMLKLLLQDINQQKFLSTIALNFDGKERDTCSIGIFSLKLSIMNHVHFIYNETLKALFKEWGPYIGRLLMLFCVSTKMTTNRKIK